MGMEALITIYSPSNLVVHGIHYDHGEEPFIKSLIKHLEEALSIGFTLNRILISYKNDMKL